MSSLSDPQLDQQHTLLGTVLRGNYQVTALLDRGGMGVVFEAEQLRLGRKVAIKVLPRHLSRDPGALLRFRREAELISALQHPHVVQVVDFDATEEGEPYIVMEFLVGETLAARLHREPVLPLRLALRIATQAALGLGAVHGAFIVHRDLKPANIFLSNLSAEGPHVKLLDFGIGKRLGGSQNLTGENDVIGTPDYMPPEQALGKIAHVNQRSDQYSLAAIVYEMLAGRTPFLGEVSTILEQVINDEPPLIEDLVRGLPIRVGPVLRRAMAKEASQRFESVVEFASALAASVGGSVPPTELNTNTTLRLTSDPGVLSGIRRAAPSAPSVPSAPSASGPSAPARSPERKQEAISTLPGVPSLSRLTRALERAKQARSAADLDLAAKLVERALAVADALISDQASAAIAAHEALIEGVLEMRLGRRERPLRVLPTSADAQPLLPEEAFLISRIDGFATAEEVLDLSPLPRLRTLRLLVRMLRRKLFTADDEPTER